MKKAAFFCANCQKPVPPGADSCPYCGLSFAGVRCPACGHQGSEKDFLEGCPACGYLSDKLKQTKTVTGSAGALSGKARKKRRPGLPGWFIRAATVLLFLLLLAGLIILYGRVS